MKEVLQRVTDLAGGRPLALWADGAASADLTEGAKAGVIGHVEFELRAGVPLAEAGVACVSAAGVLWKRPPFRDSLFLDVDELVAAVAEADADPRVRGILMDLSTPGGLGVGLEEAVAVIEQLETPVIAYSDSMMASAGYYLALGAVEIWAAGSAMVGSIGTYGAVAQTATMFEEMGVEMVVAQVGKLKTFGLEGRRFSEEEREWFAGWIGNHGKQFRDDVRMRRPGIDSSAMEGQILTGTDALARGVIDQVVPSLGQALAVLAEAV